MINGRLPVAAITVGLPPRHLTVRVPWHDAGWTGHVCKAPLQNTSCLALNRIGASRNDERENLLRGRSLLELTSEELPPCAEERGTFMSTFGFSRMHRHPYVESAPETHGHFLPTPFNHEPHSAACVPFRWLLKRAVEGEKDAEGLAARLLLPYEPRLEPELKFETSWVQAIENQSLLLDTFFGALEPRSSLVFFYAKRTPLIDDGSRIILGVGRVLSVGQPVEYKYSTDQPPLRGMLWERNVRHSIRAGFEDGFLFPYQELLEKAQSNPAIDLERCVAKAPAELFDAYSYASEHLLHDGAVASLITCATALQAIEEVLPGPWPALRKWLDSELNRLWKARGPFPGLGAALTAFGLPHGNLIAHAVNAAQVSERREWTENPWDLVEAIFDDPSLLPERVRPEVGKTLREKWKKLPQPRRQLLETLARCELSDNQAIRYYQETEREKLGIQVSDRELLENPYLLYERDRDQADPIPFGVVDRGLFPDDVIRQSFPVPEPSTMADAIDPRRVRAGIIETLEGAAEEGHTLLPRSWAIQRVRDMPLQPGLPLDEDTLSVTADSFSPWVQCVDSPGGGRAFQLERLAAAGKVVRDAIAKRTRPPRHAGDYKWRKLVDDAIESPLPTEPNERRLEERAREEKAVALSEIFGARASVLIGSAGTGKSTLLKALCSIPEVQKAGLVLLAPTGKARVRLEATTGRRGEGRTIAQFLNALGRYDGSTGRYIVDPDGRRAPGAGTIIVDECSMLTEEQLASLISALPVKYDRLILVGDPRQLPPIGAGRPFVDIVRQLAPDNVENLFPKCGPGYTELTVPRRQRSGKDDLLIAAHFSGRALEPGADEVWGRLTRGAAEGIELIPWNDPAELEGKLIAKLVEELRLDNDEDENGFGLRQGGSEWNGRTMFWLKRDGEKEKAKLLESWQVLCPIRGTSAGVDALNRAVQARFRKRAKTMAHEQGWRRKIPRPAGPQAILWGDKVINVVNKARRRVYPPMEGDSFVANGDIGLVVGEYKTQKFRGLPRNLKVEFVAQPGYELMFWESEFADNDKGSPLELAYALTVHKSQGSEFGVTFVVLPHPCRLLSRELLYTALTRHQEKLILFPQGDVKNIRLYADEASSEVASRVTNLFAPPAMVPVKVDGQAGVRKQSFLEERLVHRTERGDLVRSKSEVIIADKLHARGVNYAYEAPLDLDGSVRFPDFTIQDPDAGKTFYWEHLGLLDDPAYERRWTTKLELYRRSGILPHDEGSGPRGVLIVTRDAPGGAFDSTKIAELIDRVILG